MKTININNWTYTVSSPWVKGDCITPAITLTDPTGQQKVMAQFNFKGDNDNFLSAVRKFCSSHTSWIQAGLDDRLFLATGFFDKFI